MDVISVVVPVYNVEKYLKKCVNSLLSQTYQNIEIILVDDGSTDSSKDIADEYAQNYSNVKVFHKSNGGLSDARNFGIDKSSGKYICFLDSDDWVADDMVEVLYRNLIENEADISEAQYIRVQSEAEHFETNEEKVYIFDNIQASINLRNYELNQVVAWNKLYKKECFDKINFPVGKIHEDEFTTYKLLYCCRKIVVSTRVLFFYRDTPNSIMNKSFSEKRLDIIQAYDEAIKFYIEKKKYKLVRLTTITYIYILLKLWHESEGHAKQSEYHKIIYKKYKELYRKYWYVLLLSRSGIINLKYLAKWG